MLYFYMILTKWGQCVKKVFLHQCSLLKLGFICVYIEEGCKLSIKFCLAADEVRKKIVVCSSVLAKDHIMAPMSLSGMPANVYKYVKEVFFSLLHTIIHSNYYIICD